MFQRQATLTSTCTMGPACQQSCKTKNTIAILHSSSNRPALYANWRNGKTRGKSACSLMTSPAKNQIRYDFRSGSASCPACPLFRGAQATTLTPRKAAAKQDASFMEPTWAGVNRTRVRSRPNKRNGPAEKNAAISFASFEPV